MEPKRLSIDWGELEMALTWHADEGGVYLDVTTGQVVWFTGLEDESFEDEIEAGFHEGRLVRIEPLPSRVEYDWMAEFADSVNSQALRRLLDVALTGRGAFGRFKYVLSDFPAERQRWFAFRGGGGRQAAREWLEENGITAS